MLRMAIISGSGNYKFLNNKIPTKIIKEMRFSLIILRYITTTRIIGKKCNTMNSQYCNEENSCDQSDRIKC